MNNTLITRFAQFWAILFLGFVITSCQLVTDGDAVNEKMALETEKPPFLITSVTDQRVIQLVHRYQKENPQQWGMNDGTRLKSIEFDLASLEYVVLDGQTRGAVFAKPKIDLSESKTQYALGFFIDDYSVSGSILAKTEKTNAGIIIISYYHNNGSLIQEVTIDPLKEAIQFKYSNKQKGSVSSTDCSGGVLDCMNTMYYRLGVGSLSWWLGTAIFAPGWALGTIAGCTYVGCIQ